MKKDFNMMTIEDDEDFENSAKCWVFDNVYTDGDVKVRDHCHITEKKKRFSLRDCNISVKLNHKIPVVFHNLENYDSHLTMKELRKFSFKINVMPNGLEKYMSFSINNKLSFIDSFQFLGSSLDSLVKSLSKDDFNYFSKNIENKVLILLSKNDFNLMSDFEELKKNCLANKSFIVR